jgi:glycosyltransferase involved in cell wall biosynthesis
LLKTAPKSSVPTNHFRLLVVASDTYPPFRVDVVDLFGRELRQRGHRIDWILQSDKPCARAYSTQWLESTVWVGATNSGGSLWNRLRKHAAGISNDLKLFSLLRGGNYDAVEVKDKFVSGVFAAIAAKLFRKRFVYWLSWPFPEEYLIRARDGTARYPVLYLIRGYAFKFIFVQSEQMRRDITKEGISADRMTAVPMGIDASKFAGFATGNASRTVIPNGERCILYLGTLIKVRRLDFMIRVLAIVRTRIANAKLYFVGKGDDPSDEEQLRQEAQRLGVADNVVLVGQLPHAQALHYVQDADVCVSPFFPTPVLNSTSPTKLVEYMAMGKPVVANDHPEQRLVLQQSDAGYCVPYEEQAFADAIVKILESPEIASAMGRRGRDYALGHRTYPRIADIVEQQLLKTTMADR